jgi:hypothetical protein
VAVLEAPSLHLAPVRLDVGQLISQFEYARKEQNKQKAQNIAMILI